MKQWLVDEDLWEVIDSINAFDDSATSTIEEISASTSIDESSAVTKARSYDKNIEFLRLAHANALKMNVRTQYQLINCINENDEKLMTEKTKFRDIWMKLQHKYKTKLQIVKRQYLTELITYKKSFDIDIESTYTNIIKKSRKIAKLQLDMKIMITFARRLQTLLQFLLNEYVIIRDVIDAQIDFDVEIFIQKLQEKKTQLKVNETVMWAKNNDRKNERRDERRSYLISQRRYSSSSNDRSFNRNRRRETNNKSIFKSKKECFLCDEFHRIKNCELLRKLRKLIKRKKKKFKNKNIKISDRKHKAYNADDFTVSDASNSRFDDVNSDNEKNMKELAALFKELVNKILKSDWIADTDVSSHMTDQLRFFNEFLTSIKRRTIKIEEKILFSNQCETAIMKIKTDECHLTKVLYVSDLEINLLSDKRLIKKKLKRSFDDNDLYMHNKQNVKVLTTPARENIYIVNQIKFELNELALTVIMMSLIESVTVFSTLSAVTNTNELRSIHRIESFNSMQLDELHHESNQFDFSDLENNTSSKKRDFYTLWHRRSDHLKSAKLKNFHKVTTLKKSILIIEQRESCEVCSITKMINKRNRHLIERKTQILKLIFIDICDSLLTSRLNYEYFLKIVDNRSRKTWILSLRNRAKEVKALRKWKLKIEL